jgi:hypothetical protein
LTAGPYGAGVLVGVVLPVGLVVPVGLVLPVGLVVPLGLVVPVGLLVPIGLGVPLGLAVTVGLRVSVGLGMSVGPGVPGCDSDGTGAGAVAAAAACAGMRPAPDAGGRAAVRGWPAEVLVVVAAVPAGVVVDGEEVDGEEVEEVRGMGLVGDAGRIGSLCAMSFAAWAVGEMPPPAVATAMPRPEPEMITAARTRNAVRRPGSSMRCERITVLLAVGPPCVLIRPARAGHARGSVGVDLSRNARTDQIVSNIRDADH